MFNPLKILKALLSILAGFLIDKFGFLDEKKVLGAGYLVAALILPFAVALDPLVLAIVLGIGVALYLGVPVGELILPLDGLPGLGLFDLITSKANAGDPYRLFGLVFLFSGLAYVFSPLWLPGAMVNWQDLGLLGFTGLALLGVALFGDHVTTGAKPK